MEDGLALVLVDVGEFLDNRKDVLIEKLIVVEDTSARVEEVEFYATQGDRFVIVEKKRHIAAAAAAFLDKIDEVGQQLLLITFVLSKQGFVILLVEAGLGDECLQVFFDNEAAGDGVGFDFLIGQIVDEEGNEESVLEVAFVHGQSTFIWPVTTSLIRVLRSS